MTAFVNSFQTAFQWPIGATATTVVLDASGDKAGGIFVADKALAITHIAAFASAVAGTVPAYDHRLESVSNGVPSGSLIAANTNGSNTPSAATLALVALTASYTPSIGELVATSVVSASATAGNNATFNHRMNILSMPASMASYFHQAMQDLSAGSWSEVATLPMIVPVYTDGTFMFLAVPQCTQSNVDPTNATTPDEIGLYWTQVGNKRSWGAGVYIRLITASSDFKLKLYAVANGDSAAPVAETSISYATYNRGTTKQGILPIAWSTTGGFPATYDLVDGADYRLSIVPTSTNSLRLTKEAFGSANQRAAMSHPYYTTRTRTADGDAGTWTDDTSSTVLGFAPLVDQSNVAAGGSSRPTIIGG